MGNCVNNAEKLIKVLTEKYRFDQDHVTRVYNEEATRENILTTFSSFAKKVKEEDNLLIYLSGHGIVFNDCGYFVPVNARHKQRAGFISQWDFKIEFDSINCLHIFFIVDTCFSGAIFTSHFRNIIGYDDRKSCWGLSSCHSRELALDGKPGENSPFSKYLIKNLEDNDIDIGIHKLSAAIIDDVRREVKGKQTPIFQPLDVKGHDLGQFVFRLRDHNTFVDVRDGKVYPTTVINGKIWMTRNLAYSNGQDSMYYANDPRIGQVYGHLYTWEAAKDACPLGWRLPTAQEWIDLAERFGGYLKHYDKPKEFEIHGNPNNAYKALIEGGNSGFDAQFGGYVSPNGWFEYIGLNGFYWSSTKHSTDINNEIDYIWGLIFSQQIYHSDIYQKVSIVPEMEYFARSCRCIRDF